MESMEFVFEGQPLTVIVREGKPWFIAKEVGKILGYSGDGTDMCTVITKHWNVEMIIDYDHCVVTGDELRDIKRLLKVNDDPSFTSELDDGINKYSRNLMLLSESGLYLVCIKTQKPLGLALRRWLADEVLPAFRRRDIVVRGEETTAVLGPKAELSLRRSESRRANRLIRLEKSRLEWEKEKFELRRSTALAKMELRWLHTLKDNPHIDQRVVYRAMVAIWQKLTGDRLTNLVKDAGPNERQEPWYTPKQIGIELGIDESLVGRMITLAGIHRGDLRYSRKSSSKARHKVSKVVDTYEYKEEARQMIIDTYNEWRKDHPEKAPAVKAS